MPYAKPNDPAPVSAKVAESNERIRNRIDMAWYLRTRWRRKGIPCAVWGNAIRGTSVLDFREGVDRANLLLYQVTWMPRISF
jgi:hypothetical protein